MKNEDEENTDDIEFYSKDSNRINNKRPSTLKIVILLIIFAVLAAVIMMSPIFSVKTINCTELDVFTKSQICEMIGLNEGMNGFSFNKKKAEKVLQGSNYVENAKISFSLPNTINVDITERKVRGYVPYMGSYLYIDEFGRVLDVKTFMQKSLPVVKGLEFSGFRLGELLEVTKQESYDIVLKMSQMMTKYEMLDLVLEIDVSDVTNICANVNKIEVLLGSISQYEEKIRTMAEAVRQIPEGDRGTLDLRDLSKPIIFKYMT